MSKWKSKLRSYLKNAWPFYWNDISYAISADYVLVLLFLIAYILIKRASAFISRFICLEI